MQIEFNWTQAERDELLCAVQFPAEYGVDATIIAFVLHRIASFANSADGCYESEDRLAGLMKVSKKQISRAITALRKLDLITSEKRWHGGLNRTLVHRRIVWESLRRLVEIQNRSSSATSAGHENRDRLGNRLAILPDRLDDLGAPTGRLQPTDRTFSRDRLDAQKSNNTTGSKRTSTSIQSDAAADALHVGSEDYQAAKAALLSLTFGGKSFSAAGRAIRMACQHGVSPDQVIAIANEFRSHASRFRSMGAILYRIENGAWPVELTAPVTSAARPSATQLEQRRRLVHSAICREWRSSGRWETATDAEIEAEIDRRLGYVASE